MKRPFIALVFLFTLTSMATATDEDAGLELGGSFINESALLHYYRETNPSGTNVFRYAGMDILRLNVRNRDREQAKIEASVDLFFFSGDFADMVLKANPLASALSAGTLPLVAYIDLRKLYLSLDVNWATFTLGRQIVNYGTGMVFSPADSFSSADLSELSLTRRGSDIVRAEFPLGDTAGLDLITTLSAEMTNTASAAKVFANLGGFDLALSGVYRRAGNNVSAAFCFKGDIEAGVHGEAVYSYGIDSQKGYFEGMLGIDYSFLDGKLLLMAEYYYNDSPVDTNTVGLTNYLAIGRQFYNRHYLFGQVSWSIDELNLVSLSGLWNVLDSAWLATALYRYSLFQNTTLTVYARWMEKNLNNLAFLESYKWEYALRCEVKF